MKLQNQYTAFAEDLYSNKLVTILIVMNDQIRIVSRSDSQYKFWKTYLAPDYPMRDEHLNTGYPVESMSNAYSPVVDFGDPTSPEGKKAVQDALNALLPAKHDEILYDGSK